MPRAFKLAGVVFTQSGLPTLFDPSFFGSNLVGWWDASQGLTVNASNQVTNVADYSSGGNALGNATPANSLISTPAAQNGLTMMNAPSLGLYNVQTAAAVSALNFQLNTPFTVFVVLKRLATIRPHELVVANNNSSGFSGWMIKNGTTYANKIALYMAAASGSINVNGSTTLINGNAYNITMTYDGSGHAAGVQFYINGVAETMTINTDTATGAMANLPLCVAGTPSTQTNFECQDYIGEVAVINNKISTANIANLQTYALAKWAA